MRAIVHAMVYETHEFFPPYVDDFQKPQRYIPHDHLNIIFTQNTVPDRVIFVKEGEIYGGNSTGR